MARRRATPCVPSTSDRAAARFRVCARFFLNTTAPTEIYTLSLHDALPIYVLRQSRRPPLRQSAADTCAASSPRGDRKSTRLNSSHANISYAVFCLKKKKGHRSAESPLLPQRSPPAATLVSVR